MIYLSHFLVIVIVHPLDHACPRGLAGFCLDRHEAWPQVGVEELEAAIHQFTWENQNLNHSLLANNILEVEHSVDFHKPKSIGVLWAYNGIQPCSSDMNCFLV